MRIILKHHDIDTVRSMMGLYFICGTPNTKDIHKTLTEACKGGITCFQLREKGEGALVGDEKEQLARELQKICKEYGVPFIINDDVKLAEKIGADGVHVGQDDMDLEEVRKRLPHALVGTSINSVEELENTKLDYVDYIGVGPMYETNTKKDAKTVRGPELILALRAHNPTIPMVAIGGINRDNFDDVLAEPVDGIAVISAITEMEDIEYETAMWIENMEWCKMFLEK